MSFGAINLGFLKASDAGTSMGLLQVANVCSRLYYDDEKCDGHFMFEHEDDYLYTNFDTTGGSLQSMVGSYITKDYKRILVYGVGKNADTADNYRRPVASFLVMDENNLTPGSLKIKNQITWQGPYPGTSGSDSYVSDASVYVAAQEPVGNKFVLMRTRTTTISFQKIGVGLDIYDESANNSPGTSQVTSFDISFDGKPYIGKYLYCESTDCYFSTMISDWGTTL